MKLANNNIIIIDIKSFSLIKYYLFLMLKLLI